MHLTGNSEVDSKEFKNLMSQGNKKLSIIRQSGKGPTFKCAYGGMPDSHKGGVITPEIHYNYHNTLYPGIHNYQKDYVLPHAKANNYSYLGLGLKLRTVNPNADIRTLFNAHSQFWSVLTLLSLARIDEEIEKANLQNDIRIISTIYDSIYFEVREDSKLIKWLNNTLIPIMTTDFLTHQLVKNESNIDIGYSFAQQIELPNNATIKQINETLQKIKEK